MNMMDLNNLKATNRLLLIIAVPLVFYILKILSFIFIPLLFALFISLIFMPMIRSLSKRGVPKVISLILVLMIIAGTIFASIKVMQISGEEVMSGKGVLYHKLDEKIGSAIVPYARMLGINADTHESAIKSILTDPRVSSTLYDNFGNTFGLIRKTASLILLTVFFLVLLLAGSLNFKEILQDTMFKNPTRSIKTFMIIEKSIVKFLKVKFLVSLGTGIGFSLICLFFDISFPLFWGLLAFTINFVQMIGSVISTLAAAIFVFIEKDNPGTALGISLLFTGVQVVFGSILEPIFMGKSFSINIVAVLIMLMLWGFLWGVPGLILAIPITALVKIILEQFQNTKVLARLMS